MAEYSITEDDRARVTLTLSEIVYLLERLGSAIKHPELYWSLVEAKDEILTSKSNQA